MAAAHADDKVKVTPISTTSGYQYFSDVTAFNILPTHIQIYANHCYADPQVKPGMNVLAFEYMARVRQLSVYEQFFDRAWRSSDVTQRYLMAPGCWMLHRKKIPDVIPSDQVLRFDSREVNGGPTTGFYWAIVAEPLIPLSPAVKAELKLE